MAYSNSALVSVTRISPHRTSPRQNAIKKITIHHMAGNLTAERCCALFADPERKGSANYVVDSDGRVGMCVEEKDRAWTSGSRDNDNQAVTIEVANDGGAPGWHVSDRALEKTIELCADICRRNGIPRLNYTGNKSGNLTMHKWFAATLCPGPYLEGKFPYITEEVNRLLGAEGSGAEIKSELPYLVRVTASVLNVRKGPGTSYGIAASVQRGGAYTIVEERGGWGRLKSGAGWVKLSYTERV